MRQQVKIEKAHMETEMVMEVVADEGRQLQPLGVKIKVKILVVIVREGRSPSNEVNTNKLIKDKLIENVEYKKG